MTPQPQGYRFGDFEIALDVAELRRSGEPVHLEPRVLQLLVYLIEHRQRLVSKRELLDAVWEQQFVTENALTKAIGRLRKALHDDAQHPSYIHTHHTLGYRFIAEVEEERRSGAAGEGGEPAGARDLRRRYGGLAAATGVAVALAAVAMLIGLDRARVRRPAVAGEPFPEIRSLAVLPLANLSDDPEQEYFVEGMQEALITELARIPSLKVISRQSAMRFRHRDEAAPEISRQLGAEGLVEGSVMRDGDRVGVWVQLIHGPSDQHLWAESYEREVQSVLVLVNDVARTVAGQLEIALGGEHSRLLSAPRKVDPEAHDVYVRARHHLNQFSRGGAVKARELFRAALGLDPTFAPAHSGLGYTYLVAMVLGTPPRETAPVARAAALKAIELDDALAEAHTILGYVRLGFDFDWAGAGGAFRRALALNPSDATARHGFADYLTAMGDPEAALEQVMIGRECDPLSPIAQVPVLGHLFMLQRYDQVIAESRKAIEAFPGWGGAHWWLGRALRAQGRHEEAFAVFRAAPGADPAISEAVERAYAEAGPRGAALARAELLTARASTRYEDPLRIAGHYARAEDADQAMRWLEMAYENRSPLLTLIKVLPDFDSVRSDPRFEELVRRIGLPG